jgi:expansin (peptidoglycan-binding protein)
MRRSQNVERAAVIFGAPYPRRRERRHSNHCARVGRSYAWPMRFWSCCVVGLGLLLACGGDDDATGDDDEASDDDAGARSGAPTGSSSGGAASSSSSGGGGPTWTSDPVQGQATWYEATGGGACSFDPSPGDLDVVALDDATYGAAPWCGACLEVTGPKGVTRVRAVDRCPECEPGHIDLSKQAFVKIANSLDDGKVAVSYEFVACDVTGTIGYRYKDGSSRYWTAIQVVNHKLPITKLEYQDGGQWKEITRLDYNYFVKDEGGVGAQPNGLALRVTAVDGQVLTDTLPAFGDEPLDPNVHDGQRQFE